MVSIHTYHFTSCRMIIYDLLPNLFLFFFFPLFVFAKLLDNVLGHSTSQAYSKPQLKRFLRHGVDTTSAQAEVGIIEGVLEMGEKPVEEIMVSLRVLWN